MILIHMIEWTFVMKLQIDQLRLSLLQFQNILKFCLCDWRTQSCVDLLIETMCMFIYRDQLSMGDNVILGLFLTVIILIIILNSHKFGLHPIILTIWRCTTEGLFAVDLFILNPAPPPVPLEAVLCGDFV